MSFTEFRVPSKCFGLDLDSIESTGNPDPDPNQNCAPKKEKKKKFLLFPVIPGHPYITHNIGQSEPVICTKPHLKENVLYT